MKALFFALFAVFCASLARAQGLPAFYQGFSGGIPLGHPEVIDGLLIGTVLGPPEWPSKPVPGLVVQRVRVEDSRAFAPGAVVNVAFGVQSLGTQDQSAPGAPAVDPATALPVGERVLVVGPASRNGLLPNPEFDARGVEVEDPTPVGAAPTVRALAFFRTAAPRLASESDPTWRYLASLAAAIPGTSDANVASIARFAWSIRLPDWGSFWSQGRGDDRVSLLFAAAAAKADPYARAQVDYALNRLHYIGYSDRYEHAVIESAGLPDAFPAGIPPPAWWEDTVNSQEILNHHFQHAPFDADLARTAILRGRNSQVRVWLLNRLPDQTPAQARVLAPMLDDPDPDVRWTLVHSFVLWLKQGPGPDAIQIDRGPDGKETRRYPNLDAATQAWKAELRTLP